MASPVPPAPEPEFVAAGAERSPLGHPAPPEDLTRVREVHEALFEQVSAVEGLDPATVESQRDLLQATRVREAWSREQAGDYPAALDLYEVVAQAASVPPTRTDLAGIEGVARCAYRLERWGEAAQDYALFLQLMEETGCADDPRVPVVRGNLEAARRHEGDRLAALRRELGSSADDVAHAEQAARLAQAALLRAPNFEVEAQVRAHPQGEWDWRGGWADRIEARAGGLVDVRIEYRNTGEVRQSDVIVKSTLPTGARLRPGTTVLRNVTNPNGLRIVSDAVAEPGGINIGNYETASNAFVYFTVRLDEDARPGSAEIWGIVRTRNGGKEAEATVEVTG